MSYYVLADCNNFYVSCERLFQPRLRELPVIVLSNNDGCIVSRSQEAKNLGIGMGEPFFKVRALCKSAGVEVFSSNYSLYGDISSRIMEILSDKAPEIEIYSIDEAFLKYPSEIAENLLLLKSKELKKLIQRWVGIPLSFGIGPSKTLAKAASELAKKDPSGVFSLSSDSARKDAFKSFPIEDLWGIGRRLQMRLQKIGIFTAADFIKTDRERIRKLLGVVGERMHLELQGISCLDLETPSPKKSLTCSRSFGRIVTEFSELSEALATFTSMAAEKLRKQNGFAKAAYIFLEAQITPGERHRLITGATLTFPLPTCDTRDILTAAKSGLKKIFQEGQRYKKCGILLLDLVDEESAFPDLFQNPSDLSKKKLMDTIDRLNDKMGKKSVFFAAEGVASKKASWKMKRELLSQEGCAIKGLPFVFAR